MNEKHMIVVFDTTETFRDLFLSGPNFKLLGSYLSRNPSKLVIPKIVAEETVNHYREHLVNHLREAKSSLAKLSLNAGVKVRRGRGGGIVRHPFELSE